METNKNWYTNIGTGGIKMIETPKKSTGTVVAEAQQDKTSVSNRFAQEGMGSQVAKPKCNDGVKPGMKPMKKKK